ncbi:uncharacterized protein LOC128013492 [Carassius gibelio]|uniref:uncharacterized protein LOC128013492 n=1 Tax=Carassius gibelio TaxID=101364 RepID=UPI0022776CB2|nr:uncharacterized protein LOC128013492 [Carassius gibelio]
MAIPTMTDSSRLTAVSTLTDLNDRTSASDTECVEEPDLQPRADAEDTAISSSSSADIIVSKGEEYQTSGFTSKEDSNIQSCISSRSDAEREKKSTACRFRKRHRKQRTEITDTRKTKKTCRKDRAGIRRNSPVVSDQKTNGSSRCSKDQAVFSSRPQQISICGNVLKMLVFPVSAFTSWRSLLQETVIPTIPLSKLNETLNLSATALRKCLKTQIWSNTCLHTLQRRLQGPD